MGFGNHFQRFLPTDWAGCGTGELFHWYDNVVVVAIGLEFHFGLIESLIEPARRQVISNQRFKLVDKFSLTFVERNKIEKIIDQVTQFMTKRAVLLVMN